MTETKPPVQTNLEESLTDFESWINEHRKVLTYAVGGIIGLLLLFLAVVRFYMAPRQEEANNQMFKAQEWYGMDSLQLALAGDGNYPGFETIVKEYRWTRAANLAHYYLGTIYMRQGKFEEALTHLKKFKGKDKIISALAKGAIGDCYAELGDREQAVSYYKKAAYHHDNELVTPVYLKRAGMLLEQMQRYPEALRIYQEVKARYPNTVEGREMEKYIGRVQMLQSSTR